MGELKRILIVDDSEIDRTVLKSIMQDEFEVVEADNGYSALDIMLKKKEHVDGVILDISMPVLDGLNVLQILRENNIEGIPIFMITAEATTDNVEKALQYRVADFIKKPFFRESVLKRVRSRLGVGEDNRFTKADMEETRKYIRALNSLYNRYLESVGKDKGRDTRRADLMRILLNKCSLFGKETEFERFQIEMACKAAYLCNIGEMLQNGENCDKRKHTVLGADLISLNYAKSCKRFVEIASDMCLHHHERWDGMGFPGGVSGSDIPVFTQICSLLERFDELFVEYSRHNATQFEYVCDQIQRDEGFVSSEVFKMLVSCKSDILDCYGRHFF